MNLDLRHKEIQLQKWEEHKLSLEVDSTHYKNLEIDIDKLKVEISALRKTLNITE